MKILVAQRRKAGDSFEWALSAACGQLLVTWTLRSTDGADLWAEDTAPFFAAGIAARDAGGLAQALADCTQPVLALPAAMALWTPAQSDALRERAASLDRPVVMGDALCWPASQLAALAQRVKAHGLSALWDAPDADQLEAYGQARQVRCGLSYSRACRALQRRIVRRHQQNGVLMPDPQRVCIDAQVQISPGATLYPDVLIQGNTRIASGAALHPGCQVNNAVIGEGVTVRASVLEDCVVEAGATVGPFAMIRGGARIGPGVRIGDFVEVKNAAIGEGASAAHLAYIGDATVGKGVNIGCGAVFCNFDGREKHHTTVQDGAFIGSNANLVAPLTVGEGAFIAAGSTVTKDVPPDALYVQRSEPMIRQGWAAKRRKNPHNPKE